MNTPRSVILHCAATIDSINSTVPIEVIKKWHLKKKFKDVGYHYYITRDGIVWKGREDNVQGAHTLGQNVNTLGICYEGTLFPTVLQVDAFLNLYRILKSTYGINEKMWFGHRDFANKICPGFPIEDLRVIFRKLA